ncbi:VanZ family protein [Clostridium baratii]|uniref:VanZ family protein n=1 Tax=Clostridium baratii TaxID=1561 RepID=UPI003D336011
MAINITEDGFFYMSLICYLYLIYKIISKRKQRNKVNELVLILFGIYIIKVLSLVFFPILITKGLNVNPTVFLNPVDSIKYIIKSNSLYGIIYNIGGNFILLMPLPIFLIYFFKDKVDSLKKIILVCFLVSLSIECLQYLESIIIPSVGRFFETNDMILNTFGAGTGYIMYNKYLRKLL